MNSLLKICFVVCSVFSLNAVFIMNSNEFCKIQRSPIELGRKKKEDLMEHRHPSPPILRMKSSEVFIPKNRASHQIG